MLDFLSFLFTQFGNFILWFDSITIIGTLSLFKVILIVILFTIILRFLGGKTRD